MSLLQSIYEFLLEIPEIRNAVGTGIYRGRRPARSDRFAITLRHIATNPDYTLAGEHPAAQDIVELVVLGKGDDATTRVDEIEEHLRLALSGFRGMMGSTIVEGCTIESSGEVPIRPDDASDDWTFRYSTNYRITYKQQVKTFT